MGYRKAVLSRINEVRREPDRPESVVAAAKYLKLDPNNAGDRKRLLHILAAAIFTPARRGRRPGKPYWHKQRLIRLGSLYDIEKWENPKWKDAKIARKITKHPDFKNDDPDQIRQRLPLAHFLFQEWWHWESLDFAAADAPTDEPDSDF